MSWSNTDHITQSDWDEHQKRMKHRRLQQRIHSLRRERNEPEARTVYYAAESPEDMMDMLQAMLEDWEENENDKS